jgi:hypothetical protein
MSACTLNPFLDPTQALTIPEWYVCVEGGDPVGPVSADQIARGIRAGRVPCDAQIARSGGTSWEEALESSAVMEALKACTASATTTHDDGFGSHVGLRGRR